MKMTVQLGHCNIFTRHAGTHKNVKVWKLDSHFRALIAKKFECSPEKINTAIGYAIFEAQIGPTWLGFELYLAFPSENYPFNFYGPYTINDRALYNLLKEGTCPSGSEFIIHLNEWSHANGKHQVVDTIEFTFQNENTARNVFEQMRKDNDLLYKQSWSSSYWNEDQTLSIYMSERYI